MGASGSMSEWNLRVLPTPARVPVLHSKDPGSKKVELLSKKM